MRAEGVQDSREGVGGRGDSRVDAPERGNAQLGVSLFLQFALREGGLALVALLDGEFFGREKRLTEGGGCAVTGLVGGEFGGVGAEEAGAVEFAGLGLSVVRQRGDRGVDGFLDGRLGLFGQLAC